MSRSTSFKDIQKTLDLVGQELSILHQISQTISDGNGWVKTADLCD